MPVKTRILTVSEPDLVTYSHGLRASYGDTAPGYARQRASALKQCGDLEGEAIWLQMAVILEARPDQPVAG